MSERPPLFSVVIPAYDRAGTVARTLRSVLEQTFTDFEVIVVDDGSQDDTVVAARTAAGEDERVQILTAGHAGVTAARNAGARAARGAYLVFLDCDDEVAPGWLARFRSEIGTDDLTDQGAGPDLVFGAARALVPGGVDRVWRIERLGPAFGDIDGVFFPGMFAVRRPLFEAVGGYAVALRFSENTELGLRLTERSRQQHGTVSARAHHEQLLTVHLPADGTSHAYSDRVRFESALYLVDQHDGQLRADPSLHGSYWAIAGVAAARLGRGRDARACFARAARVDPRNPRHLGRLALALVPAVRARRWPPRGVAADRA